MKRLFFIAVLSVLVLCSPVLAADSTEVPTGTAKQSDQDLQGASLNNVGTLGADNVLADMVQVNNSPTQSEDATNKLYVDQLILSMSDALSELQGRVADLESSSGGSGGSSSTCQPGYILQNGRCISDLNNRH
tara:strand:+ start:551 stop:949 length:399 start_codon:yes stop_codon:yes gene_type:complete